MTKPKTQHPQRAEQSIDPEDYGTLFHWTRDGYSVLKSKSLDIKVHKSKSVWGASLGLQLRDTGSVIKHLREGLTITSFEHLSQAIEISPTRLAEVTSIAQRTLARRKRGGRLHLVESERVFRLGALFDKAMAVLGNETQARRWFKTPQKALGGKSPLEYSDTEIGSREVEDLLGRLEHGVFS